MITVVLPRSIIATVLTLSLYWLIATTWPSLLWNFTILIEIGESISIMTYPTIVFTVYYYLWYIEVSR